MRFLHTSDWHLGRTLHKQSLLGAAGAYVDHVLDVVRSEQVDAVIISGDLYDRSVPAPEAVKLCNDALIRLADESVRVVVISGNHDSPRRLGFASELIDAAGVHLRTDPAKVASPVTFEDKHGTVACYAIPYLEPVAAPWEWQVESRSHTAVLGAAMSRIRLDLDRRHARSLVLAHAFITGGEAGDTERPLSVGGVSHAPGSVFDGIDYVALGHLHRNQQLAENLHYSGSPLAFSFAESGYTKGSLLVEMGARGLERVDFVPAPVPRRLARISGRLEDLLTDPLLTEFEDCWLEVTLTDTTRPADPGPRLARRFPCVLKLSTPSVISDLRYRETIELAARAPMDATLNFVAEVRGRGADADEKALLHQAFDAVRLRDQELPAHSVTLPEVVLP